MLPSLLDAWLLPVRQLRTIIIGLPAVYREIPGQVARQHPRRARRGEPGCRGTGQRRSQRGEHRQSLTRPRPIAAQGRWVLTAAN
jgi:hypothetical protein